jgi:tetratricopeptide (TPR) repeat protein
VAAPRAARAHAGIGRVHLARGQPHAAARAFEAAAQFDPDHAVYQALLAASLARSGDPVRAAQHLAIARRNPDALPLIEELLRQHPEIATAGREERR